MHLRAIFSAVASVAMLGATLGGAATASAGVGATGPVVTRDSVQDTFDDDFIFDLCGITTRTTVTERWVLTQYPDGSETFHDVRTFVSVDVRIPVERGAATSFTAVDGSRRVAGKPIQLIGPDGGVRLLDAGWVEFDPSGEVSDVRGPHPSLNADLAEYYCP